MKGHAEVAGGGIGGLSAAMMLARRGWSVRIHEQWAEIREEGTGLFIKNNSIEVLEELGIFSRLAPHGLPLERAQLFDRRGRVVQERSLKGRTRVYIFLRQTLIEALRDLAQRAGVEIVTGSTASSADPEGALQLANGRRLPADLVIVADGAGSMIRQSLGIGGTFRSLPTCVNRYLVPSRELASEPITAEHWSDRYRVGITPCGENLTYIYQVCPEWDAAAMALPNNIELWSTAFPRLRHVFEALSNSAVNRRNYSIVRCRAWQRGRVAIIGDAAHGLPPTLGQGVGLTLMNTHALSLLLERAATVEDALPAWETAVRFITDRTQRWAMWYDFFTRDWPTSLLFMRPAIIWAFRSIPALNTRMRIADQGLRNAKLDLPSQHAVRASGGLS